MVGRAVLSAAANDSTKLQTLQISALADETLEGLERFQNYGFTSVPFKGAEAVVVFPQGNRDHGIVIAVDDRRYRLKGMANGEVAMYTDEGHYVQIKRGGVVAVNATRIELGAEAVEAVIKGNIFQELFNTHVHVGNGGYNTSPPVTPLDGSELSEVSFTE